jgi:hypothetical protein
MAMTTVAYEMFGYDKANKELFGDIAELCVEPARGFKVQSPTGVVVEFKLASVQRDVEGEIAFWTLVPVEGSVREDLKLYVFNE